MELGWNNTSTETFSTDSADASVWELVLDGQDPSYSPFEIHTCRNVLREAKIDPPIDIVCFLSGGATTMIFIVDVASVVNSFVMRSPISWNMVVPLDNTTLTYKFLRVSTSHFVLYFAVDLSSVS